MSARRWTREQIACSQRVRQEMRRCLAARGEGPRAFGRVTGHGLLYGCTVWAGVRECTVDDVIRVSVHCGLRPSTLLERVLR